MRPAGLAETSTMNFPAPGFSGKIHLFDAGRFAFETSREAKLLGGAAEQPIFRQAENSFAGAIYQTQAAGAIESENGDVDFFHDFAEKRGGFDRAEALFA